MIFIYFLEFLDLTFGTHFKAAFLAVQILLNFVFLDHLEKLFQVQFISQPSYSKVGAAF